MAFPNNPDDLEIEVGLNDDELDAKLNRIGRVLENAAANINKAFDSTANTGKKFNVMLLQLERAVTVLTTSYGQLGKAGAKGFEEIDQRQGQAIARLIELQGRLRDIDIEASTKGTKKSRIAELNKEVKGLRQEYSLLLRDFLTLKQLDIAVKTRIIPPTEQLKIYEFDQGFQRQLLQRDRAAFALQSGISKLTKAEFPGFETFNLEAKQALEKIVTLTDYINALQRQLNEAKDYASVEKLKKDLQEVDKELGNVTSEYINLRRQLLNAPVGPSVDPQYRFDTAFQKQIIQRDRAAFSLQSGFQKIADLKFPGSEAINKTAEESIDKVKGLTDKINRLQEELGKTTDFDQIKALKFQLEGVDKELNEIILDYNKLRRVVLETPVPASAKDKPDYVFDTQFQKQILQRDKAAVDLQKNFRKILDTDYDANGVKEFAQESIDKIKILSDKIFELRAQLNKADSFESVDVLKRQLAAVDKELNDIVGGYSHLKRFLLDVPIIPKPAGINEKAVTLDQLQRAYAQKDSQAFALQKELTRLSNLKHSGTGDIADEAKEGLITMRLLSEEISEVRRKLNGTTDQTILDELNQQAKELDHSLDRVKTEMLRLKRTELQVPRPEKGSGALSAIAQGLGLSNIATLGVAGGVASAYYGITRSIDYMQQAIEKAGEAERANRLLSSSALEAGRSYEDLAAGNVKFADSAGISIIKATELTAKVAQLATRANRPQDIEKLQKGFLDLGAARGFNPAQLGDLIQQIITGQDEGYKKLLLPNPSQLYEEFARANGRAVSSLTAVEKARIFEDKFLEKAALFNGTAEARMQSIDGRAARLSASFQNLGTSISVAFGSNITVITSIDNITKSIRSMTGSIDELYNKIKLGKLTGSELDAAIKGQSQSIFGYSVSNAFTGQNVINAHPLSLLGQGIYGLGASPQPNQSSIFNYNSISQDRVRQQLNAQLLIEARDKKILEEVKKQQAQIEKDEEARRLSGIAERRFDKVLGRSATGIEELRTLRDQFSFDEVTEDYTGPLFKEKNNQYYEKVIRRISADRVKKFREILDNPETTEQALRDALVQVQSTSEIEDYAQQDLINDYKKGIIQAITKRYSKIINDPKVGIDAVNQAIKSIGSDEGLNYSAREDLLETARKKVDELAKRAWEAADAFENLLVGAASKNNPLVQALYDVGKAYEDTYQKFISLGLGKEVAIQAAQIAQAAAQQKAAVIDYQLSDSSIKARQEAERLQALPATQTNAFDRRLEEFGRRISFINSDRGFARQAEEDAFYAGFNPYADSANPYAPTGYLGRKFGSATVDRFARGFSTSRNAGESAQDFNRRANEERQKFIDLSIQVQEYLQDFENIDNLRTGDLGIYAQEQIAKAKLERLPSREELLPRLRLFGPAKEDARKLLEEKAKAQETLRKANTQRFNDFIQNQRFLDLNRVQAEERLANLQRSGMTNREQLNEFFAITNELGMGEWSPAIRQGRIDASLAKSKMDAEDRTKAKQLNDAIKTTMDEIKTQLAGKGLKMDLGEKTILDVNLTVPTGSYVSATNTRPNSTNVTTRYNK